MYGDAPYLEQGDGLLSYYFDEAFVVTVSHNSVHRRRRLEMVLKSTAKAQTRDPSIVDGQFTLFVCAIATMRKCKVANMKVELSNRKVPR